ncbi:MAG: DUF1295 domain-containing protein [Acidimicrobiales bacterium]
MTSPERSSLIAIVVSIAIGIGVAAAGSSGSIDVGSVPLFAVAAFMAYAVQVAVFVPSFVAKTERFFDLTGSLTYLSLVGLTLLLNDGRDARAFVVAAMVALWAARLGSFLFTRISADGGDSRFDKLKTNFWFFLRTWVLQGMWVLLTLACALAILTTADPKPFDVLAWVGIAVWLAGFAIEVIADRQKSAFRARPENKGRFISSGLWAWSRHPNYFGEIVLWLGIAIMALPILSGWRYVALVSPVFVYLLLTRISGIPLLERSGKKRWGHEPEYQAYLASTPVLLLKPPTT